jgi:hypothetical protein
MQSVLQVPSGWWPQLADQIVEFTGDVLADMGQYPSSQPLELPDVMVALKAKQLEVVQALTAPGGESRIVLLHGMGGIGKTTLARAVYNELHQRNPTVCSCFLTLDPECKDDPDKLVPKQHELLSALFPNKRSLLKGLSHIYTAEQGRSKIRAELTDVKVLLVVDNVWGRQLEDLLPKDIMEVLGRGSVVLVTSREPAANVTCSAASDGMQCKGLGEHWDADVEMEFLSEQQSMELFCWHAFGSSSIPATETAWEKQIEGLVQACAGLPMALEVAGRHLKQQQRGDKRGFWKVVEKELSYAFKSVQAGRKDRYRTLDQVLEVSWNALDDEAQEAMLDIAWFLKGEEWNLVERLFGRGVLTRLEGLGLMKVHPSSTGGGESVLHVHDAMVDFCKWGPRNPGSQRQVVHGGGTGQGGGIRRQEQLLMLNVRHHAPVLQG